MELEKNGLSFMLCLSKIIFNKANLKLMKYF